MQKSRSWCLGQRGKGKVWGISVDHTIKQQPVHLTYPGYSNNIAVCIIYKANRMATIAVWSPALISWYTSQATQEADYDTLNTHSEKITISFLPRQIGDKVTKWSACMHKHTPRYSQVDRAHLLLLRTVVGHEVLWCPWTYLILSGYL